MDNNWKRKFTILWTGQFISLISSSAVNFAIIIWLSLKTGSAEVLAFSAIAALLPQALIGPFAGVYIDRWNRKRTMIFADGFVAVCTLCMSLSFYFGYESLLLIYVWIKICRFYFQNMDNAVFHSAFDTKIRIIANSRYQSDYSIGFRNSLTCIRGFFNWNVIHRKCFAVRYSGSTFCDYFAFLYSYSQS